MTAIAGIAKVLMLAVPAGSTSKMYIQITPPNAVAIKPLNSKQAINCHVH